MLCTIQGKDMNFISENLDEPVEGAGIIHCFDANTTLWQVADWFWQGGMFFPEKAFSHPAVL